MKPLKFFLLLAAALLTLAACKDKNDISNLPPATQTGANTFGCLINGKIFKCTGYISMFSMSGMDIVWTNYDSIMHIQAKDYYFDNNQTGLYIEFKCENKAGTYKNFIRINEYFPNSNSFVNITKFGDIISGTFEFEGMSEGGKRIRITNGRFNYDSKNVPLN